MAEFRLSATDSVLGIDDDAADEVFSALSNGSARAILVALHDDGPSTVSELAEETDLTAQNVSYHLEKLVEADLVETDGTCGSGSHEATVYTASGPVVVSTEAGSASRIRNVVLGLVGGGLLSMLCLQSLLGVITDPLDVIHVVTFALLSF